MCVQVLLAVLILGPGQGQMRRDSVSASDTAEVRASAAAHFQLSDSAVARRVLIRSDTAWVSVRLDSLSLSIARLERRSGRWIFVREQAQGIR